VRSTYLTFHRLWLAFEELVAVGIHVIARFFLALFPADLSGMELTKHTKARACMDFLLLQCLRSLAKEMNVIGDHRVPILRGCRATVELHVIFFLAWPDLAVPI